MSAGRESMKAIVAFLVKREDVTSVSISFLPTFSMSVMVRAAVAVLPSRAKGQENHKDMGSDVAGSWNQSQQLPSSGNFWFCEQNSSFL